MTLIGLKDGKIRKLEEIKKPESSEERIVIPKGSLFKLPAEGRITLQIPEIYIRFAEDGIPTEDDYEEIPHNWVMYVKHNRPAHPNEKSGFLHWSEAGYEVNKERIRATFNTAVASQRQGRPVTWEDFEKHAKNEFVTIRKGYRKHLRNLRKKYEAYKAVAPDRDEI